MAEGLPPPNLSWQSFAFIEGPLVEEIGEFLGRVVPVSRGVDAIGKVLPLPALQRLFKRTQEATETQQRQDGKRVIKVHTAIQIVESWLTGIGGSVQELADLTQEFVPPISNRARHSLLDRIADDLRRNALGQNKKRYVLRRELSKRGANKGFASDRTRRRVGDHKDRIPYQPDSDYPAPIKDTITGV